MMRWFIIGLLAFWGTTVSAQGFLVAPSSATRNHCVEWGADRFHPSTTSLPCSDVHFSVIDRDIATPPGSPTEDDKYIVGTGATGAWSGRDGDIAIYINSAWTFYDPVAGWLAWVQDEEVLTVFQNSTWSVLAGQRVHVRVATTANVTIATALNAGDTIDSITLAAGDHVLVKDQGTTAQNGIYVVSASPARAASFATYDSYPGTLAVVEEGTTNADSVWLSTSDLGGTIDVTAIDWAAFGTGGFTIASQAEAEAGTDNLKGMTPLRGEQNNEAWLNRGLTGNTTSVPATSIGSAFGGTWNTAHLLDTTTTGASSTGGYAAFAVVHESAGLAAAGTTNTDMAAYFESYKTSYLTTTETGQTDGVYVIVRAGSEGDSCGICVNAHKVQDTVHGQTGVEAQLKDVNSSGTALRDFKVTMGANLPTSDLRAGGFGFMTRPSDSGPATNQIETGFLVIGDENATDDANKGYNYAFMAASGMAAADEYFSITGDENADGMGRVRATGSVTMPAYAFVTDKNSGLYSISDNVLGIAANGALVMNISAGGIVLPNGGIIAGIEETTPSAPAANGYRLFSKDSGAGKTQLCVIFNTGGAQCFAVQP